MLSCSGTGGGIYAKLASEVARHNCARAFRENDEDVDNCADIPISSKAGRKGDRFVLETLFSRRSVCVQEVDYVPCPGRY